MSHWLDSRRGLVLAIAAFILGMAFMVHGHWPLLVPYPAWYSSGIERFAVALLIWTALIQSNPTRLLTWALVDAGCLCAAYLLGHALVTSWEVPTLILWHLILRHAIAGMTVGLAISQAWLSLSDRPPAIAPATN